MESEHTVTEVAMRCGFSNTTNFNRTFRRIKDLTSI
jgi:AraC-like DNA-binding protein